MIYYENIMDIYSTSKKKKNDRSEFWANNNLLWVLIKP